MAKMTCLTSVTNAVIEHCVNILNLTQGFVKS